MKKRNIKSSFSNPSDYVLPQVHSSKSNNSKKRCEWLNLLRGYDNSYSSIRNQNKTTTTFTSPQMEVGQANKCDEILNTGKEDER